jgi:hypothetical protein
VARKVVEGRRQTQERTSKVDQCGRHAGRGRGGEL